MRETEVLAAKDGLNPHLAAARVKEGGREWEVTIIKHLLCCQTLLNTFNDHEVTST